MPNLKNSPLVQVNTIKRRLLTRQLIKRMEEKINDYRRIKLSFEMIFGSILRIKDAKICFEGSLASVGIFHAFVVAEEELAVEQLDAYHSEDEVEEDVDDEDVEDVLQGVDDTVEDCFQLRNPLDGLQRSEDSKNPQRLHHSKVFGSRASPESKCMSTREPSLQTTDVMSIMKEVMMMRINIIMTMMTMMMRMMTAHVISMIKEVRAQETTIKSMQFHISRM